MANKSTVRCISPVDGKLYAERAVATRKQIAGTLGTARGAQDKWKRLTISERAKYCNAAVDQMLAMREEIVPELAMQMGRPIRFGGGELRGFEERARYMIEIAETSLKRIDPAPKQGFVQFIKREPLGVVFVVAPWNYPYLT
ncbi:MAG: aldehyde dehydrogenase family protein, partial [Methyloceanibacter sp.]